MAPSLRKLVVGLGLSGPATSFKRGLVSRRDEQTSRRPRGSPAPGARPTRRFDVLELAGGAVGYVLRAPVSLRYFARGYRYARRLAPYEPSATAVGQEREPGPLEELFETHDQRSVFKWRHYFDVYDRHLERFRGQPVHIVEIGVAGGGSLEIWRHYFGPQARVTGIDKNPSSAERAGEGIEVVIGDQGDPRFWESFLADRAAIDIVVDDGGHKAGQQTVTLEALLPHIRPGGVYICEDIIGGFQPFEAFVDALTRKLSAIRPFGGRAPLASLQQHIASVHRYPLMVVIEKPAAIAQQFEMSRRGARYAEASRAAGRGARA